MCPAFWMPNVLNAGDNGHAEIDIMEIPGGPAFGNGHTVYGTVHTRNDSHGYRHGNLTLPDSYFSGNYHDFALLWMPNNLTWFVDGNMFYTTAELVPNTPGRALLTRVSGNPTCTHA
eukprot:m.238707 g.238707  ORF g.238707 m.238707 type:complete len:117 (+) comp19394_c0_seq9:712-1062(+)